MKKTMNIGIGRRGFCIDEDAYQLLNKYLADFRNALNGAYGSDEVMDDLEMRIADIFTDEVGQSGAVVDINLVRRVIGQLGMPNGPYRESGRAASGEGRAAVKKKLYRNPDDKMLFGVCGGVAAYLNIDSGIVRLIFVLLLLSGSAGGWIYLILLIIAPMAVTPLQKCEMSGIEPTAENLNRFRTMGK